MSLRAMPAFLSKMEEAGLPIISPVSITDGSSRLLGRVFKIVHNPKKYSDCRADKPSALVGVFLVLRCCFEMLQAMKQTTKSKRLGLGATELKTRRV